MTMYNVKLTGCASYTATAAGGGLSWKKMQSRPMREDDTRLAYYRSKRVFSVQEARPPKDPPVAPSARPKAKAPKPEKVASVAEPAADLGAEEAPPLAEPAPELEGPPASGIPSDDIIKDWKKDELLELAEEYGLTLSPSMTKAEIRAEIDTIR